MGLLAIPHMSSFPRARKDLKKSWLRVEDSTHGETGPRRQAIPGGPGLREMSHSLNSLKEGYIQGYIGDNYMAFQDGY